MQSIPVDAIAIVAALIMSTMSILNRWGLSTGTPYMAAVVINVVVLILYTALCTALGVSWQDLPRAGVLWFLVAGVSSPALSMMAYYIALSRFGVARAGPIAMGSNPLFGVLLAIVFLGERPHWSLYVGTLFIVGGVWVISRPKGHLRLKGNEILIPLCAGFFWGLAASLRKLGLEIIPEPHVAVVLSAGSALVFLLASYWVFPPGSRFVPSGRALMFFCLAGLSLAVTFYFLFTALALGKVARVMAIMGSTPLLSVVLAAVFLRELEQVTLRTYTGALSIVAGVVLVSLLRG
ncbi:MAG: DMT family transporter [Nitrospinota bacterium]